MENREVVLIQFGVGGVGQALLRQILAGRVLLAERVGLNLRHVALADSGGLAFNPDGFEDEELRAILCHKEAGGSLRDLPFGQDKCDLAGLLEEIPETGRAIVLDLTASGEMEEILKKALSLGYGVALANKRPLTGPLETWHALMDTRRVRHEATVGAGLPVISTLRYLLDTGDEVAAIEGCFSGTLGYICATLENGVPFSAAVAEARLSGYTEPDPRDDLGGMDVARKALILARLSGWELEMEDVDLEALFPPDMASLSVEEFMASLTQLDEEFARRTEAARGRGNVLRYVASLREGRSRVGLEEVPSQSQMGGLKGPENIVIFHTKRYASSPLVIIGPGAGPDVTAAGVLGDIIALVA